MEGDLSSLTNRDACERGRFIFTLHVSYLRIKDKDDKFLQGKCPTNRTYTPNVGYHVLSATMGEKNVDWLWKTIWKFQCPLKACISCGWH